MPGISKVSRIPRNSFGLCAVKARKFFLPVCQALLSLLVSVLYPSSFDVGTTREREREREREKDEGSLNRYCFLRRRLRVRRRLDAGRRRSAATRRPIPFSFSQRAFDPMFCVSLRILRYSPPRYFSRSLAAGSSLDEGQDTRNLHLPEVVARHLRISLADLPRIDETESIALVLLRSNNEHEHRCLSGFSLFYDRPSRISLTRWSCDNCTSRWSSFCQLESTLTVLGQISVP